MTDKKILIVDYDPKSLDTLVNLFLSRNLQVIKAKDGQMAYEKYQTEKPDLIILEAMLPKLHGFDLAQKIYKETQGRVPVVIITGLYKGPQYRNEALQTYGAAGYFEKPFDNDEFVSSVMNLLQEEVDIIEELPSPDTVVKNLAKMVQKSTASKKK